MGSEFGGVGSFCLVVQECCYAWFGNDSFFSVLDGVSKAFVWFGLVWVLSDGVCDVGGVWDFLYGLEMIWFGIWTIIFCIFS